MVQGVVVTLLTDLLFPELVLCSLLAQMIKLMEQAMLESLFGGLSTTSQRSTMYHKPFYPSHM